MKMTPQACAFAAALLLAPIALAQTAVPANCPPDGFAVGFTKGCPQRQFANPADISAMMAALPEKPYAKPQKVRRVLAMCRATTFVHSSIPVAAKMIEYLGDKTGGWMTTISYDAASMTAENLKQYDAIYLDSTTGEFLDDASDKAATEARRKALVDFVKSGKGLVGVHAATDAYHSMGRPGEPKVPTGNWPEFNDMIGGFFKWHWNNPTLIPVKVDDAKSPLTQMYPANGYYIVDETYTFAQDSFSRKKVHVLTSVNYPRLSNEDKAKEPALTKRTDADYALSYIRRFGEGRVFYEAHGHDEKIYADRAFVLHMLAGMQYALGDLAADDSPSEK